MRLSNHDVGIGGVTYVGGVTYIGGVTHIGGVIIRRRRDHT